MTDIVKIRETGADDRQAVLSLYPQAFPDQELRPLVKALLAKGKMVLSLAAEADGVPVGHLCLTRCGLAGRQGGVALLGPVGVIPSFQGQGVGGGLIRAGLKRMAETAAGKVLVLGDPAYYGRFGFTAEEAIEPPYALPEDWRPAWQSILIDPSRADDRGVLEVPDPWRDPALWSETGDG